MQFTTKPTITLQLIKQLHTSTTYPDLMITDTNYTSDTTFHERLNALRLFYVVNVTDALSV